MGTDSWYVSEMIQVDTQLLNEDVSEWSNHNDYQSHYNKH